MTFFFESITDPFQRIKIVVANLITPPVLVVFLPLEVDPQGSLLNLGFGFRSQALSFL